MATNLENLENLREKSGKFELLGKETWKTQGKCKIFGIIVDETVFHRIILHRIAQGKV